MDPITSACTDTFVNVSTVALIVDVPFANISDAPVSDCEVKVATANDLSPLIFLPLSKAPVISDMFNEYTLAFELENVPNVAFAPWAVTVTPVTLAVFATPDVISCTLSFALKVPNTEFNVMTELLTVTTLPTAELSSPFTSSPAENDPEVSLMSNVTFSSSAILSLFWNIWVLTIKLADRANWSPNVPVWVAICNVPLAPDPSSAIKTPLATTLPPDSLPTIKTVSAPSVFPNLVLRCDIISEPLRYVTFSTFWSTLSNLTNSALSTCDVFEYDCAALTTLFTNRCCVFTSIAVKEVLVEKPNPPFDNWYSISPVALSIAVALTFPCFPTSAITSNSSPFMKSCPPNVISTEDKEPVTTGISSIRPSDDLAIISPLKKLPLRFESCTMCTLAPPIIFVDIDSTKPFAPLVAPTISKPSNAIRLFISGAYTSIYLGNLNALVDGLITSNPGLFTVAASSNNILNNSCIDLSLPLDL